MENLLQKNILEIQPESPIAHIINIDSLKIVLESDRVLTSEETDKLLICGLNVDKHASRHLSKIVNSFLRRRNITPDEFKQLTSTDYLPYLDFDVAIPLLKLEETIRSTKKEEETSQRKMLCFIVRELPLDWFQR